MTEATLEGARPVNPTSEEGIVQRIMALDAQNAEPPPEQTQEPAEAPQEAAEAGEVKEPEKEAPAAAEEASETKPTDAEGTPDEDLGIETLEELAEAIEVPLERLMALTATTKVDGKPGAVTLRDAWKSYQLEGHLNRKSMDLAEQRKAFETESAETRKSLEEKVTELDGMLSMASQMLMGEFQGMDEAAWTKLQEEDPMEFQTRYIRYQQQWGRLNQLSQAIANHRQAQAQEIQTNLEARKKDNWNAIVARFPEFSTETNWAKQKGEIDAYAAEIGFAPEEMEGMYATLDPRIIQTLMDAKAYRALQKGKPALKKKLKTLPKLQKPGTQKLSKGPDEDRLKSLKSRVRQTGSTDDVAEYLLAKQR